MPVKFDFLILRCPFWLFAVIIFTVLIIIQNFTHKVRCWNWTSFLLQLLLHVVCFFMQNFIIQLLNYIKLLVMNQLIYFCKQLRDFVFNRFLFFRQSLLIYICKSFTELIGLVVVHQIIRISHKLIVGVWNFIIIVCVDLWASFGFIKLLKSLCKFLVVHNEWHFVRLHTHLVVFWE